MRFKKTSFNPAGFLRKSAGRPFLVFFFLFLLFLGITAILFVNYTRILNGANSAEKEEIKTKHGFKENDCQNVFDTWAAREKESQAVDSVSYPELFR